VFQRKPVSCHQCNDTGFLVKGQVVCPCPKGLSLLDHPRPRNQTEAMWYLTNLYCKLHGVIHDLGYSADWNGEKFIVTPIDAAIDTGKPKG
jgi:hypothetical protein